MEAGSSTDAGTAEQAGCRAGGTRSIVGNGTYSALIGKQTNANILLPSLFLFLPKF